MMNRSNTSLEQWLYHLEHAHHDEIQLGLSRVKTVANVLGLLKTDAVVITVAGTNGKGSTVTALEAIYHQAGYRVGCYTSPHLLKFNERIRVGLSPIADEVLCALFERIETQRGPIHLTYFEVTTIAALLYFQSEAVDIILLEVGMGGRLDATNILDADVAIITTIDLDHQAYLGDTLDAIGYEKAGILRKNQTVIYSDHHPPQSILEEAARLNTHFYGLGTDYRYQLTSESLFLRLQDDLPMMFPVPKLHPNAAAGALVAVHQLQHRLAVPQEAIDQALMTAQIPGRLQRIARSPLTIVDVAHNPQAVRLLAEVINAHRQPSIQIHAIFSAFKDKDIPEMIRIMSNSVDVWYPAGLQGKRAISAENLLDVFETVVNYRPHWYENPNVALLAAQAQANPQDLIVVFGSFHTVAAVLANEGE